MHSSTVMHDDIVIKHVEQTKHSSKLFLCQNDLNPFAFTDPDAGYFSKGSAVLNV
jgi:hypothetical protein